MDYTTTNTMIVKSVAGRKIEHIPLDEIMTMLPGWNVRESNIQTYYDADIQGTAPIEGQRDTALLYKVNENDLKGHLAYLIPHGVKPGTYLPIKGNRRAWNFKDLASRGIIDPATVKRDGAGNVIPGSGKPFSTLRAEVVENLNELELFNAKLDQTSRRLTKVEVHHALAQARILYRTEKQVALRMKTLLDQYYGAPKETLAGVLDTVEKQEEYARFRRNLLVVVQAVEAGPTILRNAYLDSLRNGSNNPTQVEVKKGYSIYLKELEADALTMKINKDNPGPEFMKWWTEDYLKSIQIAAENNTRRKAAANLNAAQIDALMKNMGARSGRFVLLMVQNKITGQAIVDFNTALVDFENGKIDHKAYGEILEKLLKAVQTAAEESAAAEVAVAAA